MPSTKPGRLAGRLEVRSLAGRITLLVTIAVGLATAVVSLAAYLTVRQQTMSALDDSLRDRATAAAKTDALKTLSQKRLPSQLFGAADVRIIFVDSDEGYAYSADRTNQMTVGSQEYAVARGRSSYSARTITAAGERYRMIAVPSDDHGVALVLAQSLEPTDRMLGRLGLVALFFGLAGMIAAALAGWGVARNGLRPVRKLTDAAEEIARTQQLDPIPIEGNDEVARLAQAFNTMLGSLAASRDRQRQLVADAGHELRTPLTSLRTNLDLLAQAGERLSPQARGDLLDDVRAQIEEMTTLIGDLVELARDEPVLAAPESVELGAVVDQAAARVRRRAPGVRLDVTTAPWWVVGDGAALERAVTNLLDNAVKWSPAGGRVTARLADGTLQVDDEGPGIAEADLPHVFERFYRSSESRSMPGSGLGLSIVHAVAQRHGGTVRAGRSAAGGAAFWFSVPGEAAPPHDDEGIDGASYAADRESSSARSGL